jgi:hypothetical protein
MSKTENQWGDFWSFEFGTLRFVSDFEFSTSPEAAEKP